MSKEIPLILFQATLYFLIGLLAVWNFLDALSRWARLTEEEPQER